VFMYATNIQNDVIGLVLRQNCKSKQVTDFIAWPSRCHDTIYNTFFLVVIYFEIITEKFELNKFHASKKDPFY
jgi:hypothetical protein